MGVKIEKRLWRLLRKAVKRRLRKRRQKRQVVKRATPRARKVAASRTPATKKTTTEARPPQPRTPSAPPPRGANRLNVVRQMERTATAIDTNRAASLKEKNDLRAAREQAKIDRDEEIARRKTVRRARREARVEAAEQRRRARTTPTVIQITTTPVKQRKPTAAELAQSTHCGATCDDGTPCENPSLGQTCAAGHTPKGARRKARTTA